MGEVKAGILPCIPIILNIKDDNLLSFSLKALNFPSNFDFFQFFQYVQKIFEEVMRIQE
jgi:hypothetical protein